MTIPDGAMYQYLDLKGQSQLMPVDEALHTKGALLFYFSSEPTPGGGRPSTAHVAISLGDGRTIEARGSSYGVNEFPAAGRFNYAGMIPQMAEAGPPTGSATGLEAYDVIEAGAGPDTFVDSDHDGLSDTFERLAGLNPFAADSDGDGISDAAEALSAGNGTGAGSAVGAATAAALLSSGGEGLDPLGDQDADGLSNQYELAHGFDPFAADTDLDGLSDSSEVALGTDPTRIDTDADGLTDRIELELHLDPLSSGGPGGAEGVAAPNDPDGGLDPDLDLG